MTDEPKKKTLQSKRSRKKNKDIAAFVDGTKEEEKEPTKRMTIDFPVSLHTELKKYAAGEGVTMRALVLQWVEEGVNQ